MELISIQAANGYARVKCPTLEDPVWRMFDDDKPVTYWRLVEGQEDEVLGEVDHWMHRTIENLTGAALEAEDMVLRKRYCAGAVRLLGEIAGEVGDHSRTPAP